MQRSVHPVVSWAGLATATTATLVAGAHHLLQHQRRTVHRRAQAVSIVPPDSAGRWGAGDAEPLHLVVLGDSTARGSGADHPQGTVAVSVARGIAAHHGRPVEIINCSAVGARAADLAEQLDRAQHQCPGGLRGADIALVMVGANDVIEGIAPVAAAGDLGVVVARLRAAGVKVVVGTCPDFGMIRSLRFPLRHVARARSRAMAAAQRVQVQQSGGRAVPMGRMLSDLGHGPRLMFSDDGFHPSSWGYRRAAQVLLPHVLTELIPEPRDQTPEATGDTARRVTARPLPTRRTVLDIASTTPIVLDSWHLQNGAGIAIERHRQRFADAVHRMTGVDAAQVSRDYDLVLDRLPTTGSWFPGFVWTPGGLTYLLRPFPVRQLRSTATLHSGARLDARLLPGVKGPDHVWQAGVRDDAVRAGADDQILVDEDGFVTEAGYATIVAHTGGRLVLPQAARLPGITEQLVVQSARRRGLEVATARLTVADLLTADGVLLLSALHGVRAVTAIDDHALDPDPAMARMLQADRARHRRPVADLEPAAIDPRPAVAARGA